MQPEDWQAAHVMLEKLEQMSREASGDPEFLTAHLLAFPKHGTVIRTGARNAVNTYRKFSSADDALELLIDMFSRRSAEISAFQVPDRMAGQDFVRDTKKEFEKFNSWHSSTPPDYFVCFLWGEARSKNLKHPIKLIIHELFVHSFYKTFRSMLQLLQTSRAAMQVLLSKRRIEAVQVAEAETVPPEEAAIEPTLVQGDSCVPVESSPPVAQPSEDQCGKLANRLLSLTDAPLVKPGEAAANRMAAKLLDDDGAEADAGNLPETPSVPQAEGDAGHHAEAQKESQKRPTVEDAIRDAEVFTAFTINCLEIANKMFESDLSEETNLLLRMFKWYRHVPDMECIIAGENYRMGTSRIGELSDVSMFESVEEAPLVNLLKKVKAAYDSKILPTASSSIVGEIKLNLEKINSAVIPIKEMVSKQFEEVVELPAIEDDDANKIDAKLKPMGFDHLRAKVSLIWRLCKLLLVLQKLRTQKFKGEDVDKAGLKEGLQLLEATKTQLSDLLGFESAHGSKLDVLGLGHDFLPEMFDAKSIISNVMRYASEMKQEKTSEFASFIQAQTKELEKMLPTESILQDPKLLLQQELKDKVLKNEKKSAIPDKVLELIDLQDLLKSSHVGLRELRKELDKVVRWGKLSIGTNFALKKLAKIADRDGDAEAQKEIADAAQSDIDKKGVVLSGFLSAALASFSKSQVKETGKEKKKKVTRNDDDDDDEGPTSAKPPAKKKAAKADAKKDGDEVQKVATTTTGKKAATDGDEVQKVATTTGKAAANDGDEVQEVATTRRKKAAKDGDEVQEAAKRKRSNDDDGREANKANDDDGREANKANDDGREATQGRRRRRQPQGG